MAKVGIVKDERYLLHDMGPHPESPERLRVIYHTIQEKEMEGLCAEIPSRAATREEIETIHAPPYVDQIAETAGKPHVRLDPDTSTCAASYEAAIWAVGLRRPEHDAEIPNLTEHLKKIASELDVRFGSI